MNSTNVQPSKPNQVQLEIKKLEAEVEKLRDNVVMLESRIIDVLLPSPPSESKDANECASLVPLASQIRTSREWIDDSNSKLQDIISRIEL